MSKIFAKLNVVFMVVNVCMTKLRVQILSVILFYFPVQSFKVFWISVSVNILC